MTDDLDERIAAAEHDGGRAYLAEPEHCERCAEVDRAWAQAVCEHENAETITLLDVCGRREHLTQCEDCGTAIKQVTEVWG